MCSPITKKSSKVHRRENWRETITAALESKIHGLQQIFHMMLNYTLQKEIIKKDNYLCASHPLGAWSQSDWQILKNASWERSEPLRAALLPSA